MHYGREDVRGVAASCDGNDSYNGVKGQLWGLHSNQSWGGGGGWDGIDSSMGALGWVSGTSGMSWGGRYGGFSVSGSNSKLLDKINPLSKTAEKSINPGGLYISDTSTNVLVY